MIVDSINKLINCKCLPIYCKKNFIQTKSSKKYFKSFEEVTVDLCSSYKLLSNMTYPLKPGYTNVYSKLFPHSIAVGSTGRLAVHRVSIHSGGGVEVREEQSDKQSYL